LIGEIYVDFTITAAGLENKLRLGGIVHAARGFWALGQPFSVAAVLPEYLDQPAHDYLTALGCVDFYILGRVRGAPNVITIFDAAEVGDQGYETLLRDEKLVELFSLDLTASTHTDVLIFPGAFDVGKLNGVLPEGARLHLDVAYDLADPNSLGTLAYNIQTILISTSSTLFQAHAAGGLPAIANAFAVCSPDTILLKENRGGSRLMNCGSGEIEHLPAQLGATINSVGVGDVFAATYVSFLAKGSSEAGWRASYAAAAYSQTTHPDLFASYVQRDLKLSIDELKALSGVILSWEDRQKVSLYIAAPDFTHADRRAIDRSISSLEYHNFRVRRPVQENGELPLDADHATLTRTFQADYDLLKKCGLVFAVPTGRDPGTLVEIGLAIEMGIPVVVYDPDGENANTMVMAGASMYSRDLDACLNAVFSLLSKRLQ